MNERYNCDVIRDLLPGYIDNILSDTGSELVKNHIGECEVWLYKFIQLDGLKN